MRLPTRPRHRTPRRPRAGFTLIELLVVMVVIGILLTFILSAAFDGVRRSEERATQALIAKLEGGMTDRVEALTQTRADANDTHLYLAGSWISGLPATSPYLPSVNRTQVLARYDQLKAELPDVFVVQNDANYPLNFASVPFTSGSVAGLLPSPYENHLLPIGSGLIDNLQGGSYGSFLINSQPFPPSTGIFGASYTAAAGLYKSLYENAFLMAAEQGVTLHPAVPANAGYDATDNNFNGLVDELAENGTTVQQFIRQNMLPKHTHKTARSELLYAILVNGQGPFGSAFSPDDFRDTEVRDTDGDGLPEFIDAWGEPLQFYRWPIGYVSDVQHGTQPYPAVATTNNNPLGIPGPRDQNPLDPNRLLLDPVWWSSTVNTNSPFGTSGHLSGPAMVFQSFFIQLTDPIFGVSSSPTYGTYWDRSAPGTPFCYRRAYYSRFLILSGGPDKTPGVPVLDPTYFTGGSLDQYYASGNPFTDNSGDIAAPVIGPGGFSGHPTSANILSLQIESQAAPLTPVRSDPIFLYGNPTALGSQAIQTAGSDDITNQNLSAPGGATQ